MRRRRIFNPFRREAARKFLKNQGVIKCRKTKAN
jgi:hypothetical protein